MKPHFLLKSIIDDDGAGAAGEVAAAAGDDCFLLLMGLLLSFESKDPTTKICQEAKTEIMIK